MGPRWADLLQAAQRGPQADPGDWRRRHSLRAGRRGLPHRGAGQQPAASPAAQEEAAQADLFARPGEGGPAQLQAAQRVPPRGSREQGREERPRRRRRQGLRERNAAGDAPRGGQLRGSGEAQQALLLLVGPVPRWPRQPQGAQRVPPSDQGRQPQQVAQGGPDRAGLREQGPGGRPGRQEGGRRGDPPGRRGGGLVVHGALRRRAGGDPPRPAREAAPRAPRQPRSARPRAGGVRRGSGGAGRARPPLGPPSLLLGGGDLRRRGVGASRGR